MSILFFIDGISGGGMPVITYFTFKNEYNIIIYIIIEWMGFNAVSAIFEPYIGCMIYINIAYANWPSSATVQRKSWENASETIYIVKIKTNILVLKFYMNCYNFCFAKLHLPTTGTPSMEPIP